MLDAVCNQLDRYMSLLEARQKLVVSNVANADTPGYKTQDLDFASEFQNALRGGAVHPVTVTGLPVKNDGNNVSLDREARLLAENAIRFNLASNLARARIRMIKSAIQEGKS